LAKNFKTKFELAVVNKVREFREAKGLSQDAIAMYLDLSRGFVGQIESPGSPSKYNLNHLNILAAEFGCSPKDFMPEDPIINNTPIRKRK
jgi:transcriptional regulator with XRE-family HTH domain